MKMKRVVVAAVATTAALIGSVVAAVPAQASTQTVGFRVGSWHCANTFGFRSLNGVDVFANSAQAPNINGQWRGSTSGTAPVTITGVPAGGGSSHVVLSYTCWGKTPAPAEGDRWIYGSGQQPTYTL